MPSSHREKPGPESDLAIRKGPFSDLSSQASDDSPEVDNTHRKKYSIWGGTGLWSLRERQAEAGAWALDLPSLPLGRRHPSLERLVWRATP